MTAQTEPLHDIAHLAFQPVDARAHVHGGHGAGMGDLAQPRDFRLDANEALFQKLITHDTHPRRHTNAPSA